jgi:hypothetical protein
MMDRIGEERGRFFMLRQVLNTLFILTAIAGMLLYFKWSRDVGTYLLIASCVLKFVEVTLRLMKI